jgi:hypothetical protein
MHSILIRHTVTVLHGEMLAILVKDMAYLAIVLIEPSGDVYQLTGLLLFY